MVVAIKETQKMDRICFLKERIPSGTRETCIDRAVFITEGYREAAGDPIIIRRAKALANVLNKMTVQIFDEELVVGDQSVSQQAGHNYPDFGMWGGFSKPQRVPNGDKAGHRNLALLPDAVANASSVLPGNSKHEIEHLNDGLYNNQNSWISNGEPSWAEIDLGDAYTVSKVVFGSEHAGQYNDRAATEFRILASNDYESWECVYEYFGEPVLGTKSFEFEAIKARWVRINIDKSSSGNVRIDEIEIYGDLMADETEELDEKDLRADQMAEIAKFWQENPRLRATGSLFGHTVPGFQMLIDKGFDGIAAEARAKLENMDQTDPKQIEKEPFWKAMVIVCEAAGLFGKRYAQRAREMAEFEDDPRRKAELERIAEVCEQVPYSPARNFYEALQALWFGHLLMELEDPPNAHSIGRIDQMLYPYYRQDMENGEITREEALELLQCFALKIWKSYDVQDTMLGGQKSDGSDAVNDISFLYLEAVENLDLHLQI